MINDVLPPDRPRLHPKPKRIEPIAKPERPPLHEQAKAVDASFQTPEEVASAEVNEQPSGPTIVHHEAEKIKRFSWPPTRKQQIMGGSLAILLAFGLGASWTMTHHKRAVQAAVVKPVVKKAPTPAPIVYSTLSGLPVADASVNQKPVTGAMIENSLDARPQSGLSQAGVIFEAVAEGGVTRFLALFQDTAPNDIGPIRSARPYYVSWAMGFDAAYAHVGGSPDALSDITAWSVKDMNQFYNGSSYHRVSSRASPHNVYTSVATLNQLETAKHFTSSYTGFPRGKAVASTTPTASNIDLHLSGPTYDPHYAYNATTNSYDRSEAGEPHTDANTGKQLSPNVVIAIVVPLARGALDASGAYYSNYTTTGSGQAYIFQNGTLTTGTWAKTGNSAQMTFVDASGQAVKLNPGQTWISAVSSSNQVVYK